MSSLGTRRMLRQIENAPKTHDGIERTTRDVRNKIEQARQELARFEQKLRTASTEAEKEDLSRQIRGLQDDILEVEEALAKLRKSIQL